MKEIVGDELKHVQLDILKHVDGFCRKHSIRYFMSGGSLIGAVRHKGFIPWDDDIDIMMLRPDYEKFIAEYSEKDSSCYRVHSSRLDSHFTLPYAKVDDSRTVLTEHIEHPLSLGVNIDIFPIDILPDDHLERKRIYDYFKKQMMLFNLKQVAVSRNRNLFKNCLLVISHFLLRPMSLHAIVQKIENNAIKYKDCDSSHHCGVVVWGYGIREVNLLSNYSSSIDVPFEDMMVPVPVGYDNYLQGVYGDYMQLPPEEKRITHHDFEAWWK